MHSSDGFVAVTHALVVFFVGDPGKVILGKVETTLSRLILTRRRNDFD